MIKMILLLALSCSLFSCTTTELDYIEPEPFIFQKAPDVKERVIRVHNDDVKLYAAYVKQLRKVIEFYEQQIHDHKNAREKDDDK